MNSRIRKKKAKREAVQRAVNRSIDLGFERAERRLMDEYFARVKSHLEAHFSGIQAGILKDAT